MQTQPSLLTSVLLTTLAFSAIALPAAETRPIAVAETLAETGWTDNIYDRVPTTLALEPTAQGQALRVDVASRADLFFAQKLELKADRIYRIAFTARSQGQIEQVTVALGSRRDFEPHPLAIHSEWTQHAIQLHSPGGAYRFSLRLDGVGSFQLRDFAVTELSGFELPAIDQPARGELLPNGDFALGHLDWTFRHAQADGGVTATDFATAANTLRRDPASGHAAFDLPAGVRSLLTSGTPLHFHFHRTYTITVHGSGADGDVDLNLVRPGMAAVDSERIELRFVDGVARAVFAMDPARSGLISEPVASFGMRLRHLGEAPARITAISVHEDGAGAPTALPGRLGVETFVHEQRQRHALLGQPVSLHISSHGLTAGTTIAVTIHDERDQLVRRLPVPLIETECGIGAEVVVNDLPPGWLRIAATVPEQTVRCIDDDLAVLLPAQPGARSGFLGTHLGRLNAPQDLALLSLIGFRHIRAWEFSWPTVQPRREDPVRVPTELLDAYTKAGLEPLVLLNGTAEWASTAPEHLRQGWKAATKFPPQDFADWENYVRATVSACVGRVTTYQIWNEPNGHWLQVDPASKRSLQEVYTELARRAYPIIKEIDPDAQVIVGATAGSPGFVVQCFPLGLLEFCDGVSYHAYGAAAAAGAGAAAFSYTQDHLHAKLAEHGRPDLPIWDCESGYTIADGPIGQYGSMVLAQGLVARQAAGFDRHYIYNAVPREYPGHNNFSMIFGFDHRPLVAMPMIATWDRMLGDARFVEDLGDDAAGRHVYRFERADGLHVIAGWLSGAAEASHHQDLLTEVAGIDALGRPLTEPTLDAGLRLGTELRYFFSPQLLPQLGLNR